MLDHEIGKVQGREKNEQYGYLKNSANYLYKKYKLWVKLNTTEQPMSFDKWLRWAKGKGIVDKNFNAEGDDKIDKKLMDSKDPKDPKEVVKSSGKTIAKFFIAVSVIVIVASFVNFGSPQGQNNLNVK